jgi:HSP20 family protein
MSNLTRWEPMRDMMTLREAMDHLFDDAFTRPLGNRESFVGVAVDLYQTPDEVVVKANLPGMKAEDVQITVTNDVLTLRGEFQQETKKDEASYHLLERHSGSFERSVILPASVQSEKASADFENGVLTIKLPKVEAVKPKTITVKAK